MALCGIYIIEILTYILFVVEKRLSFAKSLASSGSQGSSELDSSPKRTLGKSILRMSPLKSTLDSNQSLRGSLMQKDEKRIQFNLDEEKMELQVLLQNIILIFYLAFNFMVFYFIVISIELSLSCLLKVGWRFIILCQKFRKPCRRNVIG